MKIKIMRSLRPIAKPCDQRVNFALNDGFYSLTVAPQDRKRFYVNLNGKLLQICALSMGLSLSPLVFFRSSRRCSPITLGTRSRQTLLRQATIF